MGHRILSSNSSVGDLLAELSTADASHGAVAASAVAAGMGSALLVMVAALPKTRSGSIDDRTTLTTIAAALIDLRKQLVDVLDAEITGRMFAARRMPQVTQTQRAERDAAIQLALRTAAHVPLEVMRLSVLGLKHGQTSLSMPVVPPRATWNSRSPCCAWA
jgi:formiminotetrahydrofolate cyclodeaminase